MLERGDFGLGIFENRIREPRIDEQNFSARGHNFESRLTIPSELRIHGNHQIEKRWSSKRNAVQGETAFQQSNFKSMFAQAVASRIFVIRHPPFVILPMIRVMNHDHAHRHISKSHPHMAELIRRSRRYEITPAVTLRPFDALAESIAYQQLNGKAAATIWGRVRALYPKTKWLDPAKVLATPDEKLRGAGLSRSKTAAIKDLAAKTLDGTVPSGRALLRMSDDEIIARLTQVHGIGRWTVEMLLLFDLGRPDVWPIADYGVQKGFAKIFRKRKLPTPKQLMKHGEKWRPYRSVAAWYFWRALDQPG
jgi:DNA-3-methyladenine glycosylase II